MNKKQLQEAGFTIAAARWTHFRGQDQEYLILNKKTKRGIVQYICWTLGVSGIFTEPQRIIKGGLK